MKKMYKWIIAGGLMIGSLLGAEKEFQRKEVDHISKEVVQPRYWNVMFNKRVLATIVGVHDGRVTLKPVKSQYKSDYVKVKISDLKEEDKEEVERWITWAPRKVYHTKNREWQTKVYDPKTHTMVGRKVRGKLIYTLGGDAFVDVAGKKVVLRAATLDEESKKYLSRCQWHGQSFSMDTEGEAAEELKKMSLKAYKYKARIYDKEHELPYQLFTPKNSLRKVPLVVFFHGLGSERGTDNISTFKHKDPLVFINEKNQRNYPCYFVAPQHPYGGRGWIGGLKEPSKHLYLVKELVMELRHKYPNIDPSRIYVTGLSSGAWGAYQSLSYYPEIYAAGLPISEAIHTDFFNRDNAKPMWILYNSGDKTSIVSDAKKLKNHLSKLGVKPKITEFKKGGHNAWKEAYGKSGIINWLFRQRM